MADLAAKIADWLASNPSDDTATLIREVRKRWPAATQFDLILATRRAAQKPEVQHDG